MFLLAERPKLSDGLGGAGGAHSALTNSRDARTDGGEAVRCSAWLNEFARLKRFAVAGLGGVILGGCIRGREVAEWVSMKKHQLIIRTSP